MRNFVSCSNYFLLGICIFRERVIAELVIHLKDGHTNFLIEDDEPHGKKMGLFNIVTNISTVTMQYFVFSIYCYAKLNFNLSVQLDSTISICFALINNILPGRAIRIRKATEYPFKILKSFICLLFYTLICRICAYQTSQYKQTGFLIY